MGGHIAVSESLGTHTTVPFKLNRKSDGRNDCPSFGGLLECIVGEIEHLGQRRRWLQILVTLQLVRILAETKSQCHPRVKLRLSFCPMIN